MEENPEWEQIDEFKELWSDFLEKMLSFVTSCLRDHSANSLNNQKWSSSLSKLLGITITKWTTVFGSRKCYEPFSDITLKLHDSYSNSGVESMSRSIAICLQDDSITMGQEFMKGILIPCGRILVGTERGFAERQVGFRIWELAIRRNWISVFLWPEENSFWCSMWQAMHFWRHILILKGVNIPNENKHYDILELGKIRREDIEAQIEQIKKMMISMLYAVIAMVTHDTFLFCTCSISDSAIYRKKGGKTITLSGLIYDNKHSCKQDTCGTCFEQLFMTSFIIESSQRSAGKKADCLWQITFKSVCLWIPGTAWTA